MVMTVERQFWPRILLKMLIVIVMMRLSLMMVVVELELLEAVVPVVVVDLNLVSSLFRLNRGECAYRVGWMSYELLMRLQLLLVMTMHYYW